MPDAGGMAVLEAAGAGLALPARLGHGSSTTLLWLGGWTAAAGCLIVLVGVWTFFCYVREGRPSLPARLALTLLRVVAAATLLLLLFEPTLRTEHVERHRSTVAVLVDRSDSMALRDRWTDPTARQSLARWAGIADPSAFPRSEWARRSLVGARKSGVGADSRPPTPNSPAPTPTTWLRRLSQDHDVRFYAFAGERRPTTLAGLSSARSGLPGDSSRLGDAIAATLDEYAGQPLAGIVLLSDGSSNRGEDPVAAAGRAAERGVPIFTVGIGDPTPPRDLAVSSLLVDDVVRKGDEVPIVVGLKHSGLARPPGSHTGPPVTTRVTLREDGRELMTQTVTLSPAGQQELQFTYRPDRAGAHTLQVTAAPLPGEISLLNNTRKAPVRVVEKRLRILYLEGSPRWEYRYLKNAILRDPSIQLACLLMDSEPSGGGEGNLKIPGFPPDQKQLFAYDIVILGDVPRASLSDAQLALLRDFVEQRGGSLIVMAGESHMPWEYRGTPLEELLPAAIPSTREEYNADQPFSLKLTEAGARHPMMQLEPDPVANGQRWATLPGSYWHANMGRVKPGASVLLEATHPSSRPLVLLQPVGEGMTFLSLLDSTWRWRFRLGDTFFYRYWGQVIRTLTPHELPGENRLVKLTADRESYQPGEPVVLRARVLTPTFHPVRAAALTAGITRDDGTHVDVRLSPLPGSPGVYSTDWTPPQAGKYRVSLRAPESGVVAEAGFAVHGEPLELQDPEMNRDLLQRIAQASGGASIDLTGLDRLPGRVPDRSELQVTHTERPLWDTPLPLALFSLLLVGEWTLRKKAGLL